MTKLGNIKETLEISKENVLKNKKKISFFILNLTSQLHKCISFHSKILYFQKKIENVKKLLKLICRNITN